MRALLLVPLVLAACVAPRAAELPTGPYVVLLGTAQDGGYPQIACADDLCLAARADSSRRRRVVSALVVDPAAGKRWLIDATPDLPDQVELARPHGGRRGPGGGRPPLFEGIFLTHGHMGHYAGLVHLGREAYGSATTKLYASASMGAYLRGNGPWSLLFEAGHLRHETLRPGETVRLGNELTLTPLSVTHRGEFSDTLAFVIEGPRRRLLYLPDIDRWDGEWQNLGEWIARYDLVLVDGTFFDGAELPGRDLSRIPHPFIRTTLNGIRDLPPEQRAKVHFFHLNHSNPVLDPASPEAAEVRARGARVAEDGMVFGL